MWSLAFLTQNRFRDSALPALPARGVAASRICSFARTETELVEGTLDFLMAISHPACMSLAVMHGARDVRALCATVIWSPKRCSDRSSTRTRMDIAGCAALTSRSGPTSSSWRSVVANAHTGMMPRCACSASPAYAAKLHVPGRLVELKQQLQLPHQKARAHCCVDSAPWYAT